MEYVLRFKNKTKKNKAKNARTKKKNYWKIFSIVSIKLLHFEKCQLFMYFFFIFSKQPFIDLQITQIYKLQLMTIETFLESLFLADHVMLIS